MRNVSHDSYDYDIPALTWAIDGLAGYMMVHTEPFSATNHRGILVPKNPDIDLEYAKHILEPIFRELKKGRQGDNGTNEYTSLPPFMIKSVKLSVPVNKSGFPDLAKQKEIAQEYLSVKQCKQEILNKLDDLLAKKIIL